MPDSDQISKVEHAIRVSIDSEQWEHVDVLYGELNRLTERDAESIRSHALAVQNSGDLARAATMLRKACRLSPEDPNAFLQLGSVYLAQKRYSEAEEAFREVLKIDPDNVIGVRHLVQCLQHTPEFLSEAEDLLQSAIKQDPDNAAIWIQLASIYANDYDRYEEAEEAFKQGLKLAPESPSAYHNYGQIKRAHGDLAEAEKLFLRGIELQHPEDSNYAFSLALCYLFMEDLDPAMKWFRKAAELDPDHNAAKVYIAFVLFLQGKMREGWEQYETRLKLREFKGLNYGRPRWDGSELDDQPILLLREQGLGDNIQFIRYAKQVAEKGGKVVVCAWEQLETLFGSVDGVSVVTRGVPEPKHFHRFCSLMSLPYILGDDDDTVPDGSSYMEAPEDAVQKWRARIEEHPGFRVGLVWRGNSMHVNDKFRSSSMAEMSQLLSIPNTSFFSLMKERPDSESNLPDGLIELGEGFDDFTDTAAAMACLDLVITVDTSICHLAGALGRPVWTMLAKGPDFRWGLKGDTTPWYDSMKLYRQSTLGKWDDVYEAIKTDIQDAIADS